MNINVFSTEIIEPFTTAVLQKPAVVNNSAMIMLVPV